MDFQDTFLFLIGQSRFPWLWAGVFGAFGIWLAFTIWMPWVRRYRDAAMETVRLETQLGDLKEWMKESTSGEGRTGNFPEGDAPESISFKVSA